MSNPYKDGLMLPVYVDADIISYRAGFSKEVSSVDTAKEKVDEIVEFIKNRTSQFPSDKKYEYYLTGKGNFREEYAVTAPYKGNRGGREKPEQLNFIRDYLQEEYNATMCNGQEADDSIAISACDSGYDCVIASIDKDFLQVPCWNYNFSKDVWVKPNQFEGLKFFYTQILTGDAADNIMGLFRVGPKTAEKLLGDCETEQDLYDATFEAYDGDTERMLENARLLWLRRYDGEIFEFQDWETGGD